MKYEDFLVSKEQSFEQSNEDISEIENNSEEELEVQKAVVESLAADTAEQQETINNLRKQIDVLQKEIYELKIKIKEQNEALGKVGEILAKNIDTPSPTQITLLEREEKLSDRFEGESRDHVLEALKADMDIAEKEGRIRHAQIIESVLMANEPSGNLRKKREEIKKIFDDNENLINGPVIEKLQELGISHKNGDEYLLASEIIKRNY